MRVQELELQLSAFVDPYLKADLIFAVPGGEGLELEEGYLTSLESPAACCYLFRGLRKRALNCSMAMANSSPATTERTCCTWDTSKTSGI